MPLRFRNYQPRDAKLRQFRLPPPKLPNIVEEIDEKLKAVRKANAERDVLNLAPRKPNWDLQRDISKKLEILEHRTQKAIYELVYEKINGSKDNLMANMARLESADKEGEAGEE